MAALPARVAVPCPFCVGSVELPVDARSEARGTRIRITFVPNLDPIYHHIAVSHPKELLQGSNVAVRQ